LTAREFDEGIGAAAKSTALTPAFVSLRFLRNEKKLDLFFSFMIREKKGKKEIRTNRNY
jgi:hypothetical protein